MRKNLFLSVQIEISYKAKWWMRVLFIPKFKGKKNENPEVMKEARFVN